MTDEGVVVPARRRDRANKHLVFQLQPRSINHLRGFISGIFGAAIKAGRYNGTNPARQVAKRRLAKRLPTYLQFHEVLPVLQCLPARWRALFATTVYTGLRKAELLGLRKTDVELTHRHLTVARSYSRDTTKGGHADVIAIATELIPYLRGAIAASSSVLVFPTPDGTMLSRHTPLEDVLLGALAHAGLAEGYDHVCRKLGCAHNEHAHDAQLRRCPHDGNKLWPKPVVRSIRFHDLRRTTASLP